MMVGPQLIARLRSEQGVFLAASQWSIVSVEMERRHEHLERFQHLLICVPESPSSTKTFGGVEGGKVIELEFITPSSIALERECELVSSSSNEDQVLLVLEGPKIDTRALHFLRMLHAGSAEVDWRGFRNEIDRESWLIACLWFQPTLTPWTRVASVEVGSVVRPPRHPGPIAVRLSAGDLPDGAALYCHLGQEILGFGGYVGRDLDGLDEVLSQLDAASIAVDIVFSDPVLLAERLDTLFEQDNYFEMLVEVLRGNRVHVQLVH